MSPSPPERLSERAERAAQADTARVLAAMGEPVRPWGDGFVHGTFPEVWFERGGWKAHGVGADQTWQCGNAIHFLMQYRGCGFEEAVDAVCAVMAPELVPKRTHVRRDLRTAVADIRRRQALLDLAKGGVQPVPATELRPHLPRASEDPVRLERAMRYLVEKRGLDADVCARAAEEGRLYVCRDLIVFPGTDTDGGRCFYFLLNTLSDTDEGRVGEHALAFLNCPWYWGDENADVVHVCATPPDALAFLSCEAHTHGPQAKDMHVMALCAADPLPVYAHLARCANVCRVVVHLADREIVHQLKRSLGGAMRIECPGIPGGYGSFMARLAAENAPDS